MLLVRLSKATTVVLVQREVGQVNRLAKRARIQREESLNGGILLDGQVLQSFLLRIWIGKLEAQVLILLASQHLPLIDLSLVGSDHGDVCNERHVVLNLGLIEQVHVRARLLVPQLA